ncbi:MAG: response regulator [Acutalibacteraceae bacterium]
MKLLIVDDEALLRERILSVLKTSGLLIHTYLTAENAFDAIGIIECEQPEIVITDIRMPSKSGLELAAHIHANYPKILVILVTGYSDFEYARAAIRNNVFEYLLKPIESENLISVVLRAQKKIETDEKHDRLFHVFKEHFANNLLSIRRQYVEKLLFSSSAPDADRSRDIYGLEFTRYRLAAIHCSTAMDSARLESEYYCTHLVENYIQQALPKTVTYVFGNLVFMLWEVREADPYDDNEALLGFLRDLHAYVHRSFLGVLSAGISRVSDTLTNMQALRHQTSECLEYIRKNDEPEFLLYEDILDEDTARWEIEAGVETLAGEIGTGNSALALERFDRLLQTVQADHPDDLYSTCLLIVSSVCFTVREHRADAAGLPQRTGTILAALEEQAPESLSALRAWIESACVLIANAQQNRTNALVSAVRCYINANYSRPVGLAEASRAVGRNPSYISRLVREHTGKSFTQLLTDKRMQEAKNLLKETNLKVMEVAERTGYTNVRYFTRVFKATVNMSPNDYRNFSAAFR